MIRPGNREAIAAAVAFFRGNIALSLSAVAVLMVVALLKMQPLVGMFFGLIYPILSFSVQIFVARKISDLPAPEALGRVAERTGLRELLTRHLDIAAGGFLGILLIVLVLMSIIVGALGDSVDLQALRSGDAEAVVASLVASGAAGTLLLIAAIGMWLGYLMPGVMGEVMLAERFAEAFRRSFLLFSPALWKRSLNADYFRLVFVWSLVVFAAATLLSWLSVSLLLMPVILVGIYVLSLYNAVVYVMARDALTG